MNYSGYESGKCVLVTGVAGFIGSNLVRRLAKDDWFIIGTDSIDDNYDTRLKYARLAEWGIPKEEIRYNKLVVNRNIEKSSFIQLDLEDTAHVTALFETYDIRAVCHLGGQVGARQSMVDPLRYVNTNVAGFINILENARKQDVEHVVYVGSIGDPHGSVLDSAFRSNELFAQVYSRTYKLPTTGVRVGMVYGPWGRPDLSPMVVADAILNDKPVRLAEYGETQHDFTYIDDVVDGLERLLKRGPYCTLKVGKGVKYVKQTPGKPLPVYRVYELGSGQAVTMGDFVRELEAALGKRARVENAPGHEAEETVTACCDNEPLQRDYDYKPKTPLKAGVAAFAAWYREWYTGERPLINEERIIVGRYPFPSTMTWKYLWNKHLEPNFRLSDDPDRLLRSLIVSDGFDVGLGAIEPEDWKDYVGRMRRLLRLKDTMSLFEVGCGAGAFLYPLYRKGFTVGGIDYASPLIHLAKLAMPGCRFEVGNAKDLDVSEQADVVLANSVFQYVESMEVAEAVLTRMFQKANLMVAVLNVPDWRTEVEEVEASRDALPLGVYNEMYRDLKHLYFERNWFAMMGKRHGWQTRVFAQQIQNYGKNDYRFNVVFKKEAPV